MYWSKINHSFARSQDQFTVCARVYIYQFPIEIARDLKWFTILSKAPTEGSENHFLSIFVILDHDAGVQSDDLRYLIPSNVRKTKHIFTFISLNREFIRIDADLKPGSWNRFCLLVDKTIRHFSLYFNDKTVYQTNTYTYPREIDQGNLWVLGFEKVGVGEASWSVWKMKYLFHHRQQSTRPLGL